MTVHTYQHKIGASAIDFCLREWMRNNIQEQKAERLKGPHKYFLLHKIAEILPFQMRLAPIYNVNGNLRYGRIDATMSYFVVVVYVL